jgi:hypothetical protein
MRIFSGKRGRIKLMKHTRFFMQCKVLRGEGKRYTRNYRDALAYVTTHLLLFSLAGVYEIHGDPNANLILAYPPAGMNRNMNERSERRITEMTEFSRCWRVRRCPSMRIDRSILRSIGTESTTLLP